MHAAHYNASVQVTPYGTKQCRFTWVVDILPDDLAGRTAEAMDAGLRAICTALTGAAAETPLDVSSLVERYVSAWHEPDPARRLVLVCALWNEHGTLVDGIAEYRGWAGVMTAITRGYDSWVATGHRWRPTGPPISFCGAILIGWELVAPDGEAVISTGTNVLVLSDAGRILSDYQLADS
jgi:hypothetical protein